MGIISPFPNRLNLSARLTGARRHWKLAPVVYRRCIHYLMPLEALCAGSKHEAGVEAPWADKQGSAPRSMKVRGGGAEAHLHPLPTQTVLAKVIRHFTTLSAAAIRPTELTHST